MQSFPRLNAETVDLVGRHEIFDRAQLFDGALTLVGSPVHLQKAPLKVRHAPPRLGEHTAEVLEEFGLAAPPKDKVAI